MNWGFADHFGETDDYRHISRTQAQGRHHTTSDELNKVRFAESFDKSRLTTLKRVQQNFEVYKY